MSAWRPPATVWTALVAALAAGGMLCLGDRPLAAGQEAGPTAATLRARGLTAGYNLDYPEALAVFQEAMRADPDDPAAPRMAAITIWMRLLFRQGAVTVEDYLGQVRSDLDRIPPDSSLATLFHQYINLASTLAEKKAAASPDDAEAHYQLGAVAGIRASYTATIEGRVRQSLGNGRRAYAEHKRCMALDPSRADAGLLVGGYRYTIAGLPWHLRVLARLAGFEGGRQEGLKLVEGAARHPGPVQPNALFTLVLLYNREGRPDDALKTIATLQALFPRNRLLWLEEAGTALRAGRADRALAAAERGWTMLGDDTRPRAYGEEARWRYVRGAALVALRQPDRAAPELDAAMAAEGPAWLKGRIQIERGRIAELAGDLPRALDTYRAAVQLCKASGDEAGEDQAKALLAETRGKTRRE